MRVLRLNFLLAIFLLAPFVRAQAQFVELTAGIEIVSWDASFYDPPSFESQLWNFRCIVGTNSWSLTASNHVTAPETWLYSGSNLVHRFPTTSAIPAKPESTIAPPNSPPITHTYTFNGDPDSGTNGPFLPPHFRIAWLAFCSGPFLKTPHRQIPQPNSFWKESWLYFDHSTEPVGFPDKTLQFEDDLGLPLSLEVFSKAGQPLLQYHIKHGRGPHVVSTNFLGWDFPLEFRAIQYLPLGREKDKWQTTLMAHGTLTSIKAGSAPTFSLKTTPTAHLPKTNDAYWVKASGAYNLITNSPALNKAKIFPTNPQRTYDHIEFTVTNSEPREILLWNVRVQVKSPGESPGTDGFGWDTVSDDYPETNDGVLKSGHATQVRVKEPNAPLWRVCLLYSKEDTNSPPAKTYSGNYEIISEPIDEAILDKVDPRP